MKKIIYISDGNKDSLFVKSNRRLLRNVKAFLFSGIEAVLFVEHEKPNFVFLKFSEPVGGSRDMMCMLKEMDSNYRLRVSVVTYNSFLPKIHNFFKNLFNNHNGYGGKREAFVRR